MHYFIIRLLLSRSFNFIVMRATKLFRVRRFAFRTVTSLAIVRLSFPVCFHLSYAVLVKETSPVPRQKEEREGRMSSTVKSIWKVTRSVHFRPLTDPHKRFFTVSRCLCDAMSSFFLTRTILGKKLK